MRRIFNLLALAYHTSLASDGNDMTALEVNSAMVRDRSGAGKTAHTRWAEMSSLWADKEEALC